ncbi:hypothetical protein [Pseudoduganella buxea]|uniref:Uncharacterized protein n=1 Tax=Pseudoduganella buxea TaxID=1949069 RepID=A0ABQ1LLH6_9BURK|nr:hypothetical protein [Pseudoduganella buxea]GGC25427.1 hypothetical protein GCM10011572_53540 [Pseudoduganella buxea]
MFIAQQYKFEWGDAYMDAFLNYEAPSGIEGHRVEVDFARVWDAL